MKRIVGLILSVLLLEQSLWAFSIKPGAVMLRLDPEKVVTVDFTIENNQKEPLKVTPAIKDSFVLEENKDIHAADWLKPLFKEVTVRPNSSKTVQFQIKAPAKAVGELAALVSFVPVTLPNKNAKKERGFKTNIVTLMTVSLYVRIKGTEQGEADLGMLTVSNRPAQGDSPALIAASVIVKNSGNVHQRPSGRFDIFAKSSSLALHTLQFESGWPVMPRSDQSYEATAPGALPPGEYEMRTQVFFSTPTVIERRNGFTMALDGNATHYYDIHP